MKKVVSKNSIKKGSRAQVSMEYLIIFGIAFALTIPLIVIYATQTNNIQADITSVQIYKIETKLSDYAEQVYYMGEPSQRTIYIDFPDGINNVILTDNSIIFNVTMSGLNSIIIKETSANITGSIRAFEGTHKLVFKAGTTQVLITDS